MINYLAVLVSAIVSMVIGSIWYGPLFGKKYMQACGMDTWSEEKKAEMKKSMMMSYVGQFIASLIMFFVLELYILASTSGGAMPGLTTAFMLWLGFVVPVKLGDMLWGGNKTLFWLSIGGHFVTLLIVGAILGAWM